MGVLVQAVEKEGEAEGDGEGEYELGGGEEGGCHGRLGGGKGRRRMCATCWVSGRGAAGVEQEGASSLIGLIMLTKQPTTIYVCNLVAIIHWH